MINASNVFRLGAQGLSVTPEAIAEILSGKLKQLSVPVAYKGEQFKDAFANVLYLKEAWYEIKPGQFLYKTDELLEATDFTKSGVNPLKFRKAVCMPHEAARFFLLINGVQMKFLQKMKQKEMEQEIVGYGTLSERISNKLSIKERFVRQWNKVHGDKHSRTSWSDNPRVWVLNVRLLDEQEIKEIIKQEEEMSDYE